MAVHPSENLGVLEVIAVHRRAARPAPEARDDPDLVALGEAVGASGSGRLAVFVRTTRYGERCGPQTGKGEFWGAKRTYLGIASSELTGALERRAQRDGGMNARSKVHLVLGVVAAKGSHYGRLVRSS